MRNLRSPGTFHEVEREQIRLVDSGLAVAAQLGYVLDAVAREQPRLAGRAARELTRLTVEGAAENLGKSRLHTVQYGTLL